MKFTRIALATTFALVTTTANAAQYQLELLPLDEIAANNFAQAITNDGTLYSTVQDEFNPPIDLSLINFESEALLDTLTDPDSAKAGNFNTEDYTTLVAILIQARSANSVLLQRLAEFRSYRVNGTSVELVPGFDLVTDTFSDYTQSTNTVIRDASDGNIVVGGGVAPFMKLPYTNEDGDEIVYVLNDFVNLGFVDVNGQVTPLVSAESRLGGYSEAYSINSNMQVAGFGATQLAEVTESAIENCNTPEGRGDIPLELCLRNLREAGTGLSDALRRSAQTRAHVWQLDASGAIIETKTYGLVFEPEADDDFSYVSRAFDINDAGIAVGESMTGDGVAIIRPGNSFAQTEAETVAVKFENDTVTELLPRDENQLSNALLINDDYIAGIVTRETSGVSRATLFVHELATEQNTYPSGFFNNAGTFPRAINNNNIIVGDSEVEASVETVREKNAYMLNIASGEFLNLNDLIACDSPYTLIEAIDINDDNVIIANARLRAATKNIRGEDVLNDAGATELRDTVYSVKLTPIPNGQIDDCQQDQDNFERKGASFNFVLFGLLLGGLLWRRKSRR